MADIRFSAEAVRDLGEIRKYIAEELGSEESAASVTARILERIARLKSFPHMGAPLQTVVAVPNDYRYLVCGNYLAFYRCEDGQVLINRILYGGRNYLKILFGDLTDEHEQ